MLIDKKEKAEIIFQISTQTSPNCLFSAERMFVFGLKYFREFFG